MSKELGTVTESSIVTLSESSGTVAWDASQSRAFQLTMTGNDTMQNPTNLRSGARYSLRLIQDGTGSRVPAWGTAFQFPGGVAPTLSSGADQMDILEFECDGSSMSLVSISLNIQTPVVAPSGLTASNNVTGAVDLAWTNNDSSATAISVQQFSGLDYVEIASVSPSTTTYHDVESAGSYQYRVKAVRNGVFSPASNSATGTAL